MPNAARRLARRLLAAFWSSVDHDTDTDAGFVGRAEQVIGTDEHCRSAFERTPRTIDLRTLPPISNVTHIRPRPGVAAERDRVEAPLAPLAVVPDAIHRVEHAPH
jgi:hypothetical protein